MEFFRAFNRFHVFHPVFHNLWKTICVKNKREEKDFHFFASERP